MSTDNGLSFVSAFDSQPTQAIGAVALDTTTTPSTIYVGTGEGNNSIDSLYGAGIYKSTDLGQTLDSAWAGRHLPSGRGSPRWRSIPPPRQVRRASLSAPPAHLVRIAPMPECSRPMPARAGLWFSGNGGTTGLITRNPTLAFATCSGDGTAPCPADDVKIDPTNPQNVYVGVDSSTVYYSNDGGQTFHARPFPERTSTRAAKALPLVLQSSAGPAKSEGGVVYAMIGAVDGIEYAGMFLPSTRARIGIPARTWRRRCRSLPPAAPPSTAPIRSTSRSRFTIRRCWFRRPTGLRSGSAALVYTSRPGNYGNSWTFMAPNGGVHSDSTRWLGIPPTTRSWWPTTAACTCSIRRSLTPTFRFPQPTINTSQIQGIGAHPTDSNKLIAGFQDNGTQLYSGQVGQLVCARQRNRRWRFRILRPHRSEVRLSQLFARPGQSCANLGLHRRWRDLVQRATLRRRALRCLRPAVDPRVAGANERRMTRGRCSILQSRSIRRFRIESFSALTPFTYQLTRWPLVSADRPGPDRRRYLGGIAPASRRIAPSKTSSLVQPTSPAIIIPGLVAGDEQPRRTALRLRFSPPCRPICRSMPLISMEDSGPIRSGGVEIALKKTSSFGHPVYPGHQHRARPA